MWKNRDECQASGQVCEWIFRQKQYSWTGYHWPDAQYRCWNIWKAVEVWRSDFWSIAVFVVDLHKKIKVQSASLVKGLSPWNFTSLSIARSNPRYTTSQSMRSSWARMWLSVGNHRTPNSDWQALLFQVWWKVLWWSRKEGDWTKNTEKSRHADVIKRVLSVGTVSKVSYSFEQFTQLLDENVHHECHGRKLYQIWLKCISQI